MNIPASFVAYCVSGRSCPTYSAVPTSELYCCFLVIQTASTVAQTFAHRFRTKCHSNVPLCLFELLLAIEPVGHCQCVCFGSCVQEKPSAFHATSLCRNSTDVRKPNCSRSSVLSSGMPMMKSSLQCTPSASSVAPSTNTAPPHFSGSHDRYHVDHLAHFPMEERHRNVKHSDDHRRVCSLGLVTRCPTRISKVGVRSRFARVHFRGTQPTSYCWAVWILARFHPFLTRFSCPVSLASLIRRPPF